MTYRKVIDRIIQHDINIMCERAMAQGNTVSVHEGDGYTTYTITHCEPLEEWEGIEQLSHDVIENLVQGHRYRAVMLARRLRKAVMNALHYFGYTAWSAGTGMYWVFFDVGDTLPGAMGMYHGYMSSTDLIMLLRDRFDLELNDEECGR